MLSLRIFKPFTANIWLLIVIFTMAVTILLNFLSRWESNRFKTSSLFLISFGAFCQQGTNHKITLISTRLLILFLFFNGLLANNFYTSELVSHLVNMKYESNIKDMNELIKSDIPIGFFNSTLIRNYIHVPKQLTFCDLLNSNAFFFFFSGNN